MVIHRAGACACAPPLVLGDRADLADRGSDVADYNGKLADPEFRRARARNAGLTRQRQPKNVTKRIDALGAYVRKVVDSFPALSDEQRDQLRAALRDLV